MPRPSTNSFVKRSWPFLWFIFATVSVVLVDLSRLGSGDYVGEKGRGSFGPWGVAFSDFFVVADYAKVPRPYDDGLTNYPPTCLVLMKAIGVLPGESLWLLVISALGLGLAYVVRSSDATIPGKERATAVLLVLASYPLLFGVVRGNLDVFATVLLLVSIRSRSKLLARVSLALAVSLKIWPAGVLVYLLLKRRFRDVAVIASLAAGVTTLCLWLVGYSRVVEGWNGFLHQVLQGNALTGEPAMLVYEISIGASLLLIFSVFLGPTESPFWWQFEWLATGTSSAAFMIVQALALSLIYLFRTKRRTRTEGTALGNWRDILFVQTVFNLSLGANAPYRMAFFLPLLFLPAFRRLEDCYLVMGKTARERTDRNVTPSRDQEKGGRRRPQQRMGKWIFETRSLLAVLVIASPLAVVRDEQSGISLQALSLFGYLWLTLSPSAFEARRRQ